MSGHDLLRTATEGMKQGAIAEKLGVTQAYVSLLLRGERTVTQRAVAQRAEQAFGIPASSWPDEAPNKRPAIVKRKAPRGVVRRRTRRSIDRPPKSPL